MHAIRSMPRHSNEGQQSINDFWLCIWDNHWAVQCHLYIITGLAAFMGKYATEDVATNFKKSALTEPQRFLVFYLGQR
jgi:hypothetical protein